MKLEKIKLIVTIIIAIGALVGIVLAVDSYFAKSEDVGVAIKSIEAEHEDLEAKDELVQERLDISITDDQIFQQRQHIQQMRNYHIFEQKEEIPPLTSMEEDALKKANKRLDDLVKVKDAKIEKYELMKKSGD